MGFIDMQLINSLRKTTSVIFILVLLRSGSVWTQGQITYLNFGFSGGENRDIQRTSESVVRVSEGLYLMSHYGQRDDLFRKENQKAIEHPFINDRSRYCSVFSSVSENSVLIGRNWDNENVGSIIVNYYHPPEGFSSISFSRSIDLGFGKYIELDQIISPQIGSRLLLAPFYAMDGMNEHGLVVAVTGLKQTSVNPKDGKEFMFITYLMRNILDMTKSVEEAIALSGRIVPFDLDINSLNGHFLVADSSGKSVILEYHEDQWRNIYSDKSWQVLSTKPVFNVPDSVLRSQCWRYRSLSENLENTNGAGDWETAMKFLEDVEQKGTTWSVIYSPTTKELYFSAYKKWDIIYHLSLP